MRLLGIPARVHEGTDWSASVSFRLHEATPGLPVFVTTINMNGTNDCFAYINKLHDFGATNPPGQAVLSAAKGGYSNTNYVVDNVRYLDYLLAVERLSEATNGLLAAGVSPLAIQYLEGIDPFPGGTGQHLMSGTTLAGYVCWGGNGGLHTNYPFTVTFSGASRWWAIQTYESYNGVRDNSRSSQGCFLQWFASNAFGGSGYSCTPVCAVTHVDEPTLDGISNSRLYFGGWASGRLGPFVLQIQPRHWEGHRGQ